MFATIYGANGISLFYGSHLIWENDNYTPGKMIMVSILQVSLFLSTTSNKRFKQNGIFQGKSKWHALSCRYSFVCKSPVSQLVLQRHTWNSSRKPELQHILCGNCWTGYPVLVWHGAVIDKICPISVSVHGIHLFMATIVSSQVPVVDSSSNEGETLESFKGNIELQDVTFAYPVRPESTVRAFVLSDGRDLLLISF